jgi:hypothetical protein
MYLQDVSGGEDGVLGRIVISNVEVPRENGGWLVQEAAGFEIGNRRGRYIDWPGVAVHGACSFVGEAKSALPQPRCVFESVPHFVPGASSFISVVMIRHEPQQGFRILGI